MNKVIIVGRLGSDPKQFQASVGGSFCAFSVATVEKFTKDGQKQEKVEWHNISAFGHVSELCMKYLQKGRMVLIEGKLTTHKTNKDGVDQYRTTIIANIVEFLGSSEGNNGSVNNPPMQQQQQARPVQQQQQARPVQQQFSRPPQNTNLYEQEVAFDDIPF